VTFLCSSYQQL